MQGRGWTVSTRARRYHEPQICRPPRLNCRALLFSIPSRPLPRINPRFRLFAPWSLSTHPSTVSGGLPARSAHMHHGHPDVLCVSASRAKGVSLGCRGSGSEKAPTSSFFPSSALIPLYTSLQDASLIFACGSGRALY